MKIDRTREKPVRGSKKSSTIRSTGVITLASCKIFGRGPNFILFPVHLSDLELWVQNERNGGW